MMGRQELQELLVDRVQQVLLESLALTELLALRVLELQEPPELLAWVRLVQQERLAAWR